MKIPRAWFNLIFAVSLLVAGLGCESVKTKLKKEDISTIRFYAESHAGLPDRTFVAKIGDTLPVELILNADPFLSEINVLKAEAWDTTDGGVAIRLELDRVGRRIVEVQSAILKGRQVAIMSHFPDARWIAISSMGELAENGVVTIYPRATPEEADRIVKGLNLLAAELEDDRDEEDRGKPTER